MNKNFMEELNVKLAKINNINVHSGLEMDVLEELKMNIDNLSEPMHVSITNTESMYYAERLPEHMKYINSAVFSLCDGMGAVLAGKFQGQDIKRFNGPDLMLQACEYGQEYGWRHYFYGGKEGIADTLVKKLKEKYPDLQIAGTYCPPFRELTPDEEKEMINQIKEAKPDIIWVGLGLIKQEKWIAKYKEELDIPLSVGVGAAFDFYAGTVKRAPEIFRKTGFEWLYRLSREPRMLKRNVNSFVFMFQAIGKGISQKIKGKK